MTQTRRLTKIEMLDHQYPGLADQMRQWFLHGIPVRTIPRLVFEKYKLSISATPVARFRRRRWVREHEMAMQQRIQVLVEEQIACEEAKRARIRNSRRGIVMNPSRRGRKVAPNA